MTHFTFTTPSDSITTARHALSALHHHLGRVVGELDATSDLSALAFATLTLETVNPPYPPVDDPDQASADPRALLTAAIDALKTASIEADTARETLRLAYVIRDLRELEASPYLDLTADGHPGATA